MKTQPKPQSADQSKFSSDCNEKRAGRLNLGTWTLAAMLALATPALGVTTATTTTHVTDMVQRVGGDDVTVLGLMGPGVDPHLYKPAASDVGTLRRADLIFYSGLMLEGRMADLFSRMARGGAKAYAVTEDIPREKLLEPEEFAGHWDPHVWFDPNLWSLCVDVVVKGLSDSDPERRAAYEQRGKALKEEFMEVHEWALERVATLPPEKRILITSHDAFNYFGQAYGFQVVAPQGLSTVTEAGLADIAKTVDFIKKNNVKAIFVESSVSPGTINRISRDSGAVVGGELFSDAMGRLGEMETGPDGRRYDLGTWSGMMMHNINTIVEALK